MGKIIRMQTTISSKRPLRNETRYLSTMSGKKDTQADASAGDANLNDDELIYDDLDDLEKERRRIMARNRAKLIALGIPVAMMELQDLARRRSQAHPRPRPRSEVGRQKAMEPTRRSTRLAGHGPAGDDGGQETEPLLQLGEGGAVEVQGPESRPQVGSGTAHVDDDYGLTEEEIAAKAEQLRQRETARLRELELEGLVDFSPDAAVFVVLGSTGNHYTVRLSDGRRSCQCMDCRVRKRDCKHIRLTLEKLQISDKPAQWYEPVALAAQWR
ncbi:hypothetical protein Vretimale_1896 [Volvox reticuliferus]|nr:hypothetical protein Vretimale_1896 [Volvox reticuliferus]